MRAACLSLVVQVRYKEDGRRSQTVSVYSQLPQTSDTEFAKAVSELQSEVRLPFVYLYNLTAAFLLLLIYFITFERIYIYFFFLAIDEVQGRREERRVQLSVLQAAGDSGHSSRQRGVSAAESGDLLRCDDITLDAQQQPLLFCIWRKPKLVFS